MKENHHPLTCLLIRLSSFPLAATLLLFLLGLLAPSPCTSLAVTGTRQQHFTSTHCLGAPTTKKQSRLAMNTEEREDTPTWCPDQQIYIGGVVPDSAEVQTLIDENEGRLRLFGYGSLCWGPGEGTLSKSGVTTSPGRARGYKRCWAQKSADHRGTTSFPGIVCTLLRDEEVEAITKRHYDAPTMTEGLLYTVPAELTEECLAELDFREKGVRCIVAAIVFTP